MLHNLSLALKNFKLPPHRWQNHIGPDADIRTNLNVEVIGIFSLEIFLENPKKYPDFDFKPLKNTQITIFRAVLRAVLGKMASIFLKFSIRP